MAYERNVPENKIAQDCTTFFITFNVKQAR